MKQSLQSNSWPQQYSDLYTKHYYTQCVYLFVFFTIIFLTVINKDNRSVKHTVLLFIYFYGFCRAVVSDNLIGDN